MTGRSLCTDRTAGDLQNAEMPTNPRTRGRMGNTPPSQIPAAPRPERAEPDALTIAEYEEVLADHRRLVREIDVTINGEEGAAKQASLCDLVGQIEDLVAAKAAPPAVSGARLRTCVWTNDDFGGDSLWEPQCGGPAFEWTTDGPIENGAKFCLYCGGALVVHLTSTDRPTDDDAALADPAHEPPA